MIAAPLSRSSTPSPGGERSTRRSGGERVLNDDEAVIDLESQRLAAYNRTAHLRQQIGEQDFRALYEARWQDRAHEAGWQVAFEYGETGRVTLVFHRER